MIQLLIIIFSLGVAGLAFARLFMPRAEDYKEKTPYFDIREYFNGDVLAWGVIKDWRGRVTQRFTLKMHGRWKGNKGELEEFFTFDDGSSQQRLWVLDLRDEHRFEGHAADVVGVAVGKQYGNTVHMNYVLRLSVSGKTYDISMDDWLYLQEDGVVINEARMKVYGLPVGRLITTFRKP